MSDQCLLYPPKETSLSAIGMSALCQEQTSTGATTGTVQTEPGSSSGALHRAHQHTETMSRAACRGLPATVLKVDVALQSSPTR
jgi:hypothetical protein